MLKTSERKPTKPVEGYTIIAAWGEPEHNRNAYAATVDGEAIYIIERDLGTPDERFYSIESSPELLATARNEIMTKNNTTTTKSTKTTSTTPKAFDKYSGSALCRFLGSVSNEDKPFTKQIASRICAELGVTISDVSVQTALSDGRHPEQKYGKVPVLNVKEQKKVHALRNRFEREIAKEAKEAAKAA